MAAGDVKAGTVTVPGNNGTATIQPLAGEEWVIHNISYTAPDATNTFQVFRYDGTNTVLLDSDSTGGSMQSRFWHLTSTQYLQLKNSGTGTTAITVIYDGVQTK